MKRLTRLKTWLWLAAAGAMALAIWCFVLYAVITRYEGTPRADVPVSADVGIVLGATLWNDAPSPGLRERLDLALELYRSGAFENFIVTGGLDANGATITEAEGMRNYLISKGVRGSVILMDTESRSTYENLLFAKGIMELHAWTSAVILTHDYHGSRAADIARKLNYEPVQVRVTRSKVLKMSYHETREVLAYTKWLATKMFL